MAGGPTSVFWLLNCLARGLFEPTLALEGKEYTMMLCAWVRRRAGKTETNKIGQARLG